mmetsp:Transcript_26448/g.57958  ORF Transcript_26448/g.57958 Transcript_26448/m.57958 type:complete len:94 (-) Transcript_26448:65-346(-)
MNTIHTAKRQDGQAQLNRDRQRTPITVSTTAVEQKLDFPVRFRPAIEEASIQENLAPPIIPPSTKLAPTILDSAQSTSAMQKVQRPYKDVLKE